MTRLSRLFVLAFILLTLGALLPRAHASAAPQLSSARSMDCTANNASVHFEWQPVPGGQAQWLDLSVTDDSFAPGTFVGYGGLPAASGSMNWSNLEPGVAHFGVSM